MALIDDIVAYYKLDDTTDAHASYDLTNNNSASFATGLIGDGVDFGTSNTNRYLSIASNLGISGGACSFSFWINFPTALSSNTYWALFGQQDQTTDTYYEIWLRNDAGTHKIVANRIKLGVSNNEVTYNVTLSTDTWHHAVLTYDGTTLKGYINTTHMGDLNTSGNGTGNNPDGFAIGRTVYTSTDFTYDGKLDEMGVWSRALTTDEIAELYNSGAGLTYPFVSSAVKDPIGPGFIPFAR